MTSMWRCLMIPTRLLYVILRLIFYSLVTRKKKENPSRLHVSIDDIEKERWLFSWGQTQVYWAFRVTLSLVLCAALKIWHEEPVNTVEAIKYAKAPTITPLKRAFCSRTYAVCITFSSCCIYITFILSPSCFFKCMNARRMQQSFTVRCGACLYASTCNISHWGCNLSHKFLIHSLY